MNNTTKSLIFKISKFASIILLILAIASFGVLIVFKTEYWHEHLLLHFNDGFAWSIGAIIPLIVEGMRFALLMASTQDIKNRSAGTFILGLIGSFGLFIYEIFYACPTLGAYWDNSHIYTDMFILMACMGMIVELRLVLLAKGEIKQSDKNKQQEPGKVNKMPFSLGKFSGPLLNNLEKENGQI